MDQSSAVWILVVLALVTANLPFVVERPFLALPWTQSGEPSRASWLRWIESLVLFCLLAALGYGALLLIGRAFFSGSSEVSVALFLLKLVAFFVIAAALLGYAGWRNKGCVVKKSFLARLIEVLVFYWLVGMLGFSFEANIGNSFHQTWEFYVITLCLFLVLGYPGFVFRYLMRNRRINETYPE
ncbi:MAG: DUF2818 family protein [Candidimonas sp.]|nr:MAG: DUF2818 family protein [Candidimonas sp.]TAM24312.1 MAG: DUF2818 family protein [Candidimonas sp.]TAM81229.1 MAG: DUF2818 family protein [Candidimonas sp.]